MLPFSRHTEGCASRLQNRVYLEIWMHQGSGIAIPAGRRARSPSRKTRIFAAFRSADADPLAPRPVHSPRSLTTMLPRPGGRASADRSPDSAAAATSTTGDLVGPSRAVIAASTGPIRPFLVELPELIARWPRRGSARSNRLQRGTPHEGTGRRGVSSNRRVRQSLIARHVSKSAATLPWFRVAQGEGRQ